ncbi:hypothetical protein D3C81_1361410 [compost metagenome]
MQVVGISESYQAVGAIGELGVQGHYMVAVVFLAQYLVQLADSVYLRILLGDLAREGQGVGVAELRGRQPDQVLLRVQFLDLGIGGSSTGHALFDMVVGHQ